jgi:hypothetical protein
VFSTGRAKSGLRRAEGPPLRWINIGLDSYIDPDILGLSLMIRSKSSAIRLICALRNRTPGEQDWLTRATWDLASDWAEAARRYGTPLYYFYPPAFVIRYGEYSAARLAKLVSTGTDRHSISSLRDAKADPNRRALRPATSPLTEWLTQWLRSVRRISSPSPAWSTKLRSALLAPGKEERCADAEYPLRAAIRTL